MTTDESFRRRTVFVAFVIVAAVALAAAAVALRTLILMTFLAVLIAILLRAIADRLHAATGLKRSWAVLAIAAVVLFAVGLAAFLLAPTIAEQARALAGRIPEAAEAVQRRLGDRPWLFDLWKQFGSSLSLPDPGDAMGQAARLLGGITSSVGYLGLVLVAGLYLALEPDLYRRGFMRLVPVRYRAFTDSLLDELDGTVLAWFGGQLALMVFVGVMIGLGLWAIGVPYALALGLLAGLLEFIPYIGPILSATPALLVAFSTDPTLAAWTLLVFVVVQQLENNVLQPLIQKSAVDVPPVLLVVTLVAAGMLFGVAGLLVAAPLTAVMLVVVRRIYVERILEAGTSAADPPARHP